MYTAKDYSEKEANMAAPPSAADAVKSEEQKVAEVKPAEISKEPEETEEFPDPDEDDLDDLDGS